MCSFSSAHLKLVMFPQCKLTSCAKIHFCRWEDQWIITFLSKRGNEPKVIHAWILAICDASASLKYQVKYLSQQFKWDREPISDGCHPVRPVEVTSLQMCQKLKTWQCRGELWKCLWVSENVIHQNHQFWLCSIISWAFWKLVFVEIQECWLHFKNGAGLSF